MSGWLTILGTFGMVLAVAALFCTATRYASGRFRLWSRPTVRTSLWPDGQDEWLPPVEDPDDHLVSLYYPERRSARR